MTHNVDLSTLTPEQLLALSKDLDNKKEQARKDLIVKARLNIEDHLKSIGLTIRDIYNISGEKKERAVVKPKYRNPNNHDQVWTGRGKRPNWMPLDNDDIESFKVA